MFSGTYQHSLDAKGRLILPAPTRAPLAEGCVVTAGQDHCLYLYPTEEWERVAGRLRTVRLANRAARDFTRFFFSSASPQAPDGQGRILIPENLRAYARLARDVTVLGVDQRVEIWERGQWETVREGAERLYAEMDSADPELPF